MANLSTIFFSSMTPSSTGANGSVVTFPLVSAAEKGCGYYGKSEAVHTIQYSTGSNFVGLIKIQGTLVETPTEADWYDITGAGLGNGITPVFNQTFLVNFAGNHVWVRAKIETFSSGVLNSVQYSHN